MPTQRRRPIARRWRACALATIGLILLAAGGCERRPQSPATPGGILAAGQPLPNIVFILVDTQRADRLGAYGHDGGLSPLVDSLAREGVTFMRCISAAPWTLPSVASYFTSYYPSVHKTTRYISPSAREIDANPDAEGFASVLPSELLTLAEALQQAGYQTAGISANRFVSERFGFAQGFEHFNDDFDGDTVPGRLVNDALRAWLDGRSDERPLFLYLHYMDVHGPYDAAPRFMDPLMERLERSGPKRALTRAEFEAINVYLRKPPPQDSDPTRFERLRGYLEYWEARYDAGVAEMDYYLSELRDYLRSKRLWDDAYVIYMADHGEALCEHGRWDHGYTLYTPEMRVPLILRWPDMLPAGKRVIQAVSTMDLMPTLLEQLRISTRGEFQGESLTALLAGRANVERQPVLGESLKGLPVRIGQTVVHDEWKLVRFERHVRGPDGRLMPTGSYEVQLFNLAADPYEQRNVVNANPGVVSELLGWLEEQNALNDTIKPDLVVMQAATDARRFAELGYVGTMPNGDLDDDVVTPATQPATRPEDEWP